MHALIAIAANLPCLMESCSNFLRPAYPYTGCRLSSLTGSKPHGEHSCQLRLLFFLFIDCYQPCLIFYGTDSVSGCCTIFRHRPASDADAAAAAPSLTGFYPRTLADPCTGGRSLPGFWNCTYGLCPVCFTYVLSAYLRSCVPSCSWMFNILHHLFRIIFCPMFQDCIKHPQDLAGYHNQ